MIKQNDIIELEIEKVIFEGIGLSRLEGIAVFVKGVLPDEKIKAKVLKVNKNFIKAELIEILKPSKYRIKPICPMSKPCGACDLAFVDYNYSTQLKEDIVSEIFKKFEKTKILSFIKSENALEYRHKTQYPTTQTKNSKRILAGYYKEKTHEIVNIKYCPIQKNVIDKIVDFIRENWDLGAYEEKNHKGLLRHINTRISNFNNDILITLVLNTDKKELNKIENKLNLFKDKLIKNFPQIKGVLINLNNEKTNKITGEETVLLYGNDFIFEKLTDGINEFTYKIGSNSFFQVNVDCANLLFNSAKKLITKKGTLLDLYGGVGTIGIFMKDISTKITLVEENKEAIKLAKENFKLNEILKYEIFESDANKKMKDFIKEKKSFENIIIDPPRKGSDNETLDLISKMTDSIIYISCNPMTLKRDAEILIEKGFEFKSVQGVDMFPHTHHIECVAHFKREQQ